MAIRADCTKYNLTPRYTHKRGNKPLSGFALDITIRFNSEGTAFLQDHNLEGANVMPFTTLDQLQRTLNRELEHHYESHFASG
jgi:hypothetical protein